MHSRSGKHYQLGAVHADGESDSAHSLPHSPAMVMLDQDPHHYTTLVHVTTIEAPGTTVV